MDYVHGYETREYTRLQDQAATLVELLHSDTRYPVGSKVLEAGCGIGAQTVTLAGNSPDADFTSIDISAESIAKAQVSVKKAGISNVAFKLADIYNLSFDSESFDHIFLCFVLEHLQDPLSALAALKRVLKTGGSLTVIEGDHGSAYFYPDNVDARSVIQCQVELQKRAGGNANIGRELYPLLDASGYQAIHISPRMVYVDSSKPELVEGFTKNTFTAMIEGVRDSSIGSGIINDKTFDSGIRALYRTAEKDGVFCYTFFKGICRK